MKEQTKKRKEKAERNKEKVNEIMKDAKISKKLSKVDQNKLILKAMNTNEDNNEEKIVTNKMSTRHFKCTCGCEVTLEGDVARDNKIQTCSTCSR
jgi:hypothetical protein